MYKRALPTIGPIASTAAAEMRRCWGWDARRRWQCEASQRQAERWPGSGRRPLDGHHYDRADNVAIYHLSIKIIGRSKAQSAVAAAAYRSATKLEEERTGQTHDYGRKQHVEAAMILAPDHAPAWVQNREQLWNQVEAAEKRKDAQLAREVEIALPRELDKVERQAVTQSFVQAEFVSKGMIADVAFHTPRSSDGQSNPHAHIMLTLRELDGDQFAARKARHWNPAFTVGDQVKDKGQILDLRAKWSAHCNIALEKKGSAARIDHRSYEDQGINREAQPKLGKSAHMARRNNVFAQRKLDEVERIRYRNAMRMQQESIAVASAAKLMRTSLETARRVQQSIVHAIKEFSRAETQQHERPH